MNKSRKVEAIILWSSCTLASHYAVQNCSKKSDAYKIVYQENKEEKKKGRKSKQRNKHPERNSVESYVEYRRIKYHTLLPSLPQLIFMWVMSLIREWSGRSPVMQHVWLLAWSMDHLLSYNSEFSLQFSAWQRFPFFLITYGAAQFIILASLWYTNSCSSQGNLTKSWHWIP